MFDVLFQNPPFSKLLLKCKMALFSSGDLVRWIKMKVTKAVWFLTSTPFTSPPLPPPPPPPPVIKINYNSRDIRCFLKSKNSLRYGRSSSKNNTDALFEYCLGFSCSVCMFTLCQSRENSGCWGPSSLLAERRFYLVYKTHTSQYCFSLFSYSLVWWNSTETWDIYCVFYTTSTYIKGRLRERIYLIC